LLPESFDVGAWADRGDADKDGMCGGDLSGAAIVTGDYDGTIRVFLRRSCLDAAFRAAGPEGQAALADDVDVNPHPS